MYNTDLICLWLILFPGCMIIVASVHWWAFSSGKKLMYRKWIGHSTGMRYRYLVSAPRALLGCLLPFTPIPSVASWINVTCINHVHYFKLASASVAEAFNLNIRAPKHSVLFVWRVASRISKSTGSQNIPHLSNKKAGLAVFFLMRLSYKAFFFRFKQPFVATQDLPNFAHVRVHQPVHVSFVYFRLLISGPVVRLFACTETTRTTAQSSACCRLLLLPNRCLTCVHGRHPSASICSAGKNYQEMNLTPQNACDCRNRCCWCPLFTIIESSAVDTG